MRPWFNALYAALLISAAFAAPAFAATPYSGCPAGYHRAEAEGGGVGSENLRTRKAEALADMPCVRK
jgi:hypothetical protein